MRLSSSFSRGARVALSCALALAGFVLNFAAVGVSQAQDGDLPVGSDTYRYQEAVYGNRVNGLLWFTMNPRGDWEFGGNVNREDYVDGDGDTDWFANCTVQSSAGQLFQLTSAGTFTQYRNGIGWPAAGHPRVAGRNPEIAAHWIEIASPAAVWDCSLGSQPHGDKSPIDIAQENLERDFGTASSIVQLVLKLMN